jgi:hypothetical protein
MVYEKSVDAILSKICINGKYYNPAWSHYQEGAIVSCDRCQRTHLNVCIGWNEYDMCLKCIDEMSLIVPKKPISVVGKDNDWKHQTLMRQDMFRDHTYMM